MKKYVFIVIRVVLIFRAWLHSFIFLGSFLNILAHAHLEHLEQLIRLQDQRLLLAERQFEADLKVLVDEFDDERDEVNALHVRARMRVHAKRYV